MQHIMRFYFFLPITTMKRLLISLFFLPWVLACNSTAPKLQETTIYGKTSILKDDTGLVYVAVDIKPSQLKPYLDKMKSHLGAVDFAKYRAGQQKRDHNKFHLTLLNPFEYEKLVKANVALPTTVMIKLVGLGSAKNEKDRTFFVVAESAQAQAYRRTHKLPRKDLHVTLGFNENDVFGVSKARDSLVR